MNGLVSMYIRFLFALATILCVYALVTIAPSPNLPDASIVALSDQPLFVAESSVSSVSYTASAKAVAEPLYSVVLKLLIALGIAAVLTLKLIGLPESVVKSVVRGDS